MRAFQYKSFVGLFALCAGLFSSGCFSTHFRDKRFLRAEEKSEWRSFFFWGLAGDADVNLGQLCPAGVSELEIKQNVGTWFATVLTLGIYAPQILSVTCAAPPGAPAERFSLELDGEGRPARVTEQLGARLRTGEPIEDPERPGRWEVALEEVRR